MISKGGFLIPIQNGTYIQTFKELENTEIILTGIFEVDPETVGMQTGIVDKNNRMICQGDVCRFKAADESGIFEVDFQSSTFVAIWKEKKNFTDIMTSMMYLQCSEELEVLGTIYDFQ